MLSLLLRHAKQLVSYLTIAELLTDLSNNVKSRELDENLARKLRLRDT